MFGTKLALNFPGQCTQWLRMLVTIMPHSCALGEQFVATISEPLSRTPSLGTTRSSGVYAHKHVVATATSSHCDELNRAGTDRQSGIESRLPSMRHPVPCIRMPCILSRPPYQLRVDARILDTSGEDPMFPRCRRPPTRQGSSPCAPGA